MKLLWTLLFYQFCFVVLSAQEDTNQLDFSLLRQNDKVRIDSSKNLYFQLKEIQFGEKSVLSFGGSHRFQIEGFVNEEFEQEKDQSDYWFLNRSMLHGHVKSSDWFEFFVEVNASLISSKTNLAPVDRDELGVNQAFFDLQLNKNWSARIGRQNFRLGSGRLIDVREGPNVRLSFDMIDLTYINKNTKISTFLGGPVRPKAGIFDNDAVSSDEFISGVYWMQNWSEMFNTDTYMIYKNEEDKTWDSGTADDQRISLGLRYFGDWKGLTYNNEVLYQLGSFGNQSIRAWTISFDVNRKLEFFNNHPGVLGVRTELISGDRDSGDNVLNTFDGLYPRGAYFGRVARFGPSNLFDIHPYVEIEVGEVSLEFDYVAFWRLSTEDGIYGPPLNLAYPDNNDQRFIGHQIGGIISYSPFKNFSLELESNVIFPAGFLKDSGLDDHLVHVVFTSEVKF
ncbi:MAG: alginate export family protein [Bacteroidota bacterium]